MFLSGGRYTPSLKHSPPPPPFLPPPPHLNPQVCASLLSLPGQISLSSELQPSSLPPDQDPDPDQDESSSDMLVIVDDPVSSAPQSRATNSPVSVSGSMSDNMNGKTMIVNQSSGNQLKNQSVSQFRQSMNTGLIDQSIHQFICRSMNI